MRLHGSPLWNQSGDRFHHDLHHDVLRTGLQDGMESPFMVERQFEALSRRSMSSSNTLERGYLDVVRSPRLPWRLG